MTIRLAGCDDLPKLLKLYKELRPHDPELLDAEAKAHWQMMVTDERTHEVVAEVDGELASSCALTINLSIANGAKPFGMIEHVITASKFRRRGHSKQVLEFAIELAWQKNCGKLMLLSGEQLSAAHALYQSVGFQSGIEKGFAIKPSC